MTLLSRLHDASLNRPFATILTAWAIILTVGLGADRLRLNMDGAALVPPRHPAVVEDQMIRERFGLKDAIVIVLTAPQSESIFSVPIMRRVQEWTLQLQTLPGIGPADVFSLATESSDRVVPGTLRFQNWLDPFPDTLAALKNLRDGLRAIGLYHGTLVAHDESATAIMVSVPRDADRSVFTARVLSTLEECEPLPENVSFIGAPMAEALLGTHLLQDLGLPGWIIGRHGGLAFQEAPHPTSRHTPLQVLSTLSRFGLVPLAMMVIGAVILLSFGSPLACLLPMAKVGACLIFVFGLMGLFGSPVYLPTAVMPVILTVSAITEEVHLLSHYASALRQNPTADRQTCLNGLLTGVHIPMIKTAITTAVGFLSFAAAPIDPIRGFGIWTCVGVLFSMGYSLLVTPAFFALIPRHWLFPKLSRRSPHPRSSPPISARFFAGWGRTCVRCRHVVIALTIGAVLVAPLGIRKIMVQDSWIDGFAPESEFARAAHFFNGRFLGMHALHIAVESHVADINTEIPLTNLEPQALRLPVHALAALPDVTNWHLTMQCAEAPQLGTQFATTPRPWSAWIARVERNEDQVRLHLNRFPLMTAWNACPGEPKQLAITIAFQPWLQPAMLAQLDRLESFLSAKTDLAVGGVVGPATYLKTTNFIIWARQEGARTIPADPERIQWLWQQYAASRGEVRLRQVVDADFRSAVLTMYLKNANFVDTARLLAEIRRFEEEHLNPFGMTIALAGDVAVSQGMISTVVSTPIRSIVISLVGILAVASLVGRSLRVGLLCALPSSIAVLLIFGFMGWGCIPLGVATSMFAAMTLGIGDDFAIHLMERFRHALDLGMDRRQAVVDAVSETGLTLTVDTLALALGFGVLIGSQVPANARLGLLLVLSLAVCWAASLVVLPAVMAIIPVRRSSKGAPAPAQA